MFSLLLVHSPVPWLPVFIALLGGYLSGSVPWGLLLGKWSGHGDIRKVGSGNIGTTNMLRLGGKKLAALTLLLDALKGLIPVLIGKHFHIDYAVMAGLGAFLGHLFPVWLKFKGGKGVATTLGVLLGLSWKVGLLALGTWVSVALLSGYSSLSALIAVGLAPLFMFMFTRQLTPVTLVLILAILVWIKHHANIRRLANGTESKINLGKKK